MPPPARLNYTHDAMIDMIVANPRISQGELAAMFGYTQPWVSIVMSSDAFRERLAARKAEIVDPVLIASVDDKFRAVVDRSLAVLQEKLSRDSGEVSDQLALQAAALGARALGKGGFSPSGQTQVNIQINAEERLARVASRISSLVRETREVCDAQEVQEVQEVPQVGISAEAI